MSDPDAEDVRLPSGPLVRIRAPGPADGPAIDDLLASPGAARIGRLGERDAGGHGSLVAELPWGGQLVGHAAWGRMSGPRASVAITVRRSFARWPVASHLLVRLARLADAALVPTLLVEPGEGTPDLERTLVSGFGGERAADGAVEISTREWASASATLEHRSAAFDAPSAAPATAPGHEAVPAGRGPVVIAGGGVAALECMMALRDLCGPALQLQLVSPADAFHYRPLQVAEPFSLEAAPSYPLASIAGDCGAELVRDAIAEVRPAERQAVCASGALLDYEALVLALGARPEPVFEHAITFGQDPRHGRLRELLVDIAEGSVRDVAFVVPPGTSWSLPLYELALMTARELIDRDVDDANLLLVSPEPRPLAIFGPAVSASVGGLLAAARVEFLGDALPTLGPGSIELEPAGRRIEIDAAVALPALRGPALAGVPCDDAGFIRTDPFGAVPGLADVFAAGDATTFPVKQGGLAAQQADAVAQTVAARLGAPVTAHPFEPVLRGLLFTGDEDRFLRTGIGGGEGDATVAASRLWWPPAKIAGLYLAPYLYARAGMAEPAPRAGFSEVEVELERQH